MKAFKLKRTSRALHGVIPLKSIMANHHVDTSGKCPIFHQAAEDLTHLLFQCITTKETWRLLGLDALIEEAITINRAGSTMFEFILRGNNINIPGFTNIGLKETITMACWYLWWLWRRCTHGETIPPISHCRMSVLSIISNYAKIMNKQKVPDSKWTKLGYRQVKVNVDGSFHPDVSAGSAGAVIRDHDGRFLAASTTYFPNIASAAAAEALAMREGLALANQFGCTNIVAESDAMEIIDGLSGEETWWGEYSAIFSDCIDVMTLIGNVSFKHCPREANEVAHELARFGFTNKNSCNWVDEPPSFILGKLINDVTIDA